MSDRPPWQLDVGTAKRECQITLRKWEAQIRCLRQLVKDSDSFTPDALRVSFEDSVPEMKRAAQGAIARFQILLQIRAGTMRWQEDESEQGSNERGSKGK
jgi:hypothetical protein